MWAPTLALLFYASTAAFALGLPAPESCSPAVTVAAIFAASPIGCDANGDMTISAGDLVVAAATATAPECPSAADLRIDLLNRSGSAVVRARFHGRRVQPSCHATDQATEYDIVADCPAESLAACAVVTGLAPGAWAHSVDVESPATGQQQHQPSQLVGGGAPNQIEFTAFAASIGVDSTANSGGGSLRQALQGAAAQPKPLLIWFDEVTFPAGARTVIPLDFALTALSADDVTIDGTDSSGESANRVIDARGLPIGALSITGARNRIVGLAMRGAGSNDRDVLNLSGAEAGGNVIERCLIEQAASADGIGVGAGAGSDSESGINLVRDCEVRGAADKGIKVTTQGRLRVENSWIHDNVNGGAQATLSGHLVVVDSLIEANRGGSAQNGLAVQAVDLSDSDTYLEASGTVSRGNGANGVSVRSAEAVIKDSYLATNGTAGIRVFNDLGPAAEALVEGTSAVCNAGDGAVVADESLADFGRGALLSSGDNAFTQNNLPAGFANFRNATGMTVRASDAQWEHCGRQATCDEAEIRRLDLNDRGQRTEISPAQAHRALTTPLIRAVRPDRGQAGQWLRIFGEGFNVIDGHAAEADCADVESRNRCVPLRGNCVRIGGVPAPVVAVTPTMLVVRWPFTCLAPVSLTVTVDKGPTGVTSDAWGLCGTGESAN